MSDEFDKEAEREKLREKYEADQKDRESTQRMSELLLQGATMTGKHCNNCGDPIFRYDGQEFCPSCQNAAQEAAQAETTETTPTAESAEASGGTETTRPAETDDASQVTPKQDPETRAAAEPATGGDSGDGEPRVEINDVRVAGQHSHDTHRRPPSQQDDQSHGGRESGKNRESVGERGRGRRTARSRSHGATTDGDLADARDSLVRKLTDLARQAEQTDDVSRSRELLAATREAAEALDALDRANR
ncbi:Sjogren's syndrome/scleroderma autoantigen 1 family protein [Halorussus halophilus]|uniref:Sjogren's syndrome/scleroderma autoantigen 1 family protein n=1 Tax=Halorussus halophilus TaxID=2650975 RepID=UPI001300E021|nr:Sjogren's syndrome/scleroderma autoantigen 1 family protein [Halorussus halophilus]